MRNIRARQINSRLPYMELDRRGLCYLFCEVGNKRGFLVGHPGILSSIRNQKFISLTVMEEKKYKPIDQYMRMQMGKTKQSYTDLATYRCRIIGKTQSMQPYSVWEIV